MNRITDTLVQVLDQYTGENVTYNKTTVNEQGTAITDADCDGVIYRKLGSEYFKRSIHERIHPRWFGAKGDGTTNDSAILNSILSKYTRYIVDGEGLTYRAFDIVLNAGNKLQNIKLNCNDNTKTVIRFGNLESGSTVYNSGLVLKDITFTGTFNYGLIVSNCVDFSIDHITFFGATAVTDFMYLNRMYEGYINNIQFPGCTGSLTTKCINCNVGVNGVTISQVYTSGFIGYGIFIASGASITIQNPVIQGHAYGMWITGCTGITIINPYFEQTVNPIVVDNSVIVPALTGGEVNGVRVINGIFLMYLAGHTFAAQDNLVFVKHKGSNGAVSLEGCRFANTGTKKIASVDGSAVMTITNPHLQGSSFLDLRQQCYKESTAVSTAGYYMQFHGGVNGNNTAYVTVRRTSAGSNGHITEYTDAGGNKIYSTSWAPPIIGNSQPTDTWYTTPINATPKTGSYTLTTTDEVIMFNTTSNMTATLPAAPPQGKIYVIKKTNASNTLTVTVSGGVITIDGSTTYAITGLNDVVEFEFDGTNYRVRSFSKAETDPVFLAQKGAANGVALLDASSLVPVAQIPNLDAAKITTGTLATARLGSGTANSTSALYGDSTWKVVPQTNQRADLTTAQTDTDLNTLYPSAVIGTRVIAKNITGGGIIYEKDTSTTWVRVAILTP